MGAVTSMCDGPREQVVKTEEVTTKDKKKKKKKKKKKEEEDDGLNKFERAALAAKEAVTDIQKYGDVGSKTKKKLKESFIALDADGNGTLTIDELDPFLRGVYVPTDEETKEFLEKFDHDGDGEISFPEFSVGMKRMFPGEYDGKESFKYLKDLFSKYDKDGSELLQEEELMQLSRDLMQINPGMKKKCMMLFDVNGDNQIEFDEFLAVVVKLKGDLNQLWVTHRKTSHKQQQSKDARAWKVKKEKKAS